MAVELPAQCTASPPWSSSALRRLSWSLRDGLPAPPDCPHYQDVLIWYDDLARAVSRHLGRNDWTRTASGLDDVQITFRAKTIDTLREKLQRTPAISLGYVQDVAGVRMEADISTVTQDAIARAVVAMFGQDDSAIKDYRVDAHSGYRAVHVWLRFPAGRVEVQIRTRLQGQWANTFEAMADFVGRGVRYGVLPPDPDQRRLVAELIDISVTDLSELEGSGNDVAVLLDQLEDFRESVVSGISSEEEGLALLDELEPRVTALRDSYPSRAEGYHRLLVNLENSFRKARGQ